MKGNLIIGGAVTVGVVALIVVWATTSPEAFQPKRDITPAEVERFREGLDLHLELPSADVDGDLAVVLRVTNLSEDPTLWYEAARNTRHKGVCCFANDDDFMGWYSGSLKRPKHLARNETVEMTLKINYVRRNWRKYWRGQVKDGKVRVFVYLDYDERYSHDVRELRRRTLQSNTVEIDASRLE